MKQITKFFLLVSFIVLAVISTASAQVLVDSATVGIYPYFSKNDTVVYSRNIVKSTVNGTDTTVTSNTNERFMIICKKADDKKGYVIEETSLGGEVLLKDSRGEIYDKINEFVPQAFTGMKVTYNVNAEGNEITIVNPDKVIKEMTDRLGTMWDSITTVMPLFKTFMPKESIQAMAKSIMASPEMLMKNFEEISQLFEFHGRSFDLNKKDSVELTKEDDPTYSRNGVIKFSVSALTDEGKAPEDWDDYLLQVESVTYQDALKVALYKARELNPEITEDQLKYLLNGKMPKGELRVEEAYYNSYSGQGWPILFVYAMSTTNLETNAEELELHGIKCESYSFDNK